MAVRQFLVSNPNPTNVTTNGKTAVAEEVTSLGFDDAALVGGWNDLLVFLTNGCIVADNLITTEKMQEAADEMQHGSTPGH
jgi:hypothetical protein